ncbi:hypothetical protein CHUAL_003550 [Chamberlinius hualienensis]
MAKIVTNLYDHVKFLYQYLAFLGIDCQNTTIFKDSTSWTIPRFLSVCAYCCRLFVRVIILLSLLRLLLMTCYIAMELIKFQDFRLWDLFSLSQVIIIILVYSYLVCHGSKLSRLAKCMQKFTVDPYQVKNIRRIARLPIYFSLLFFLCVVLVYYPLFNIQFHSIHYLIFSLILVFDFFCNFLISTCLATCLIACCAANFIGIRLTDRIKELKIENCPGKRAKLLNNLIGKEFSNLKDLAIEANNLLTPIINMMKNIIFILLILTMKVFYYQSILGILRAYFIFICMIGLIMYEISARKANNMRRKTIKAVCEALVDENFQCKLPSQIEEKQNLNHLEYSNDDILLERLTQLINILNLCRDGDFYKSNRFYGAGNGLFQNYLFVNMQ